jgi:hypothetical protein
MSAIIRSITRARVLRVWRRGANIKTKPKAEIRKLKEEISAKQVASGPGLRCFSVSVE